MVASFWLEVLGYVASVLVAVSLMMSSILRLRIMNLIGSLTFGVYGVLIGAVPVAAVNFFIATVNVYYLIRFSRTRTFFSVLEVRRDSTYLDHFLRFHEAEIRRFVPSFSAPTAGGAEVNGAAGAGGAAAGGAAGGVAGGAGAGVEAGVGGGVGGAGSADATAADAERGRRQLTLFVLRDVVPAGVLIGDQRGDTLHVDLDFAVAGYRDFQIGRYLFAERADLFRARGIARVASPPGTRAHTRYLRRMGFRGDSDTGVLALRVG